ncbi:MAG: hypothetical protein V7708_04470 [Oceanicoccus sp.]
MPGESFGDVFAKSCIDPSTLTDGEIVQIREYYDANLYLIRRLIDMIEGGDFEYSLEQTSKPFLRHCLDSKVGRLHYVYKVDVGLDPVIAKLSTDFLEINLINPCRDLAIFCRERSRS